MTENVYFFIFGLKLSQNDQISGQKIILAALWRPLVAKYPSKQS